MLKLQPIEVQTVSQPKRGILGHLVYISNLYIHCIGGSSLLTTMACGWFSNIYGYMYKYHLSLTGPGSSFEERPLRKREIIGMEGGNCQKLHSQIKHANEK